MEFKTFSDADDAGFVVAHVGRVDLYRECEIVVRDTSGADERGYRFGMFAIIPEHLCADEKFSFSEKSEKLASSEEVLLSEEKNTMRQAGCFVPMFSPGERAAGIGASRAWIDEKLEAKNLK